MSTIVGKRNAFVVPLSIQRSERPGLLARGAASLLVSSQRLWGCSVSRVSLLPFPRSEQWWKLQRFHSARIPSVLPCMFPFWLIPACSFWDACSADLEGQITVPLLYTDITSNWWMGSWGEAMNAGYEIHLWWRDQPGLHYRFFPSVAIEWTGWRLGYAVISFSCGWFPWHEALEDTLRSWWCFEKL